MVKPTLHSLSIYTRFGPIDLVFGPGPVLQAHSYLQLLQNSFVHHPQVRQRKYHQQLAGVLGQTVLPA